MGKRDFYVRKIFKYLKLKSGVMRVKLSFRNPKQSLRRQKKSRCAEEK